MNSLPVDTVTRASKNHSEDAIVATANPRAESTPVARKRRMMDQQQPPSSSSINLLNKASKKNLTSTISSNKVEKEEEEEEEEDDKEEINNEIDQDKIVQKPPIHPDTPRKRIVELSKRNDTMKLRKTIQWLENGAKKLRDDLADVRSELHEEKRAMRMLKKNFSTSLRETRNNEAIKYQSIIADLKIKLSHAMENTNNHNNNNNNNNNNNDGGGRADFIRDENHKREILAARRRLAEADEKIRLLKNHSIIDNSGGGSGGGGNCYNSMKRRKIDEPDYKRMDYEIRNLRQINKRLEDKLQIVTNAERARAVELRTEYEKHAAEMSALKKSLRSETIKMMDEIKNKEREIEKLEKIKLKNESMRKLRDNERDCQMGRLEFCTLEANLPCDSNNSQEQNNLREVAVEQQEIIEYLRQALKERERKLDQLTNKKRKEEFYKQWLELEPVAEVDDEDDSALSLSLSSGPSSLSPQPPSSHHLNNTVPRESYEHLLIEYEDLQKKFINDHEELLYAKSQIRDLEKALLQETRASLNNRRLLGEKLKEIQEREVNLLAELSDIREQNELLEFRILELEETGGSRETPDDTADSGIVSPELIQNIINNNNNNNNKQQRAIATVIPYNNNNNNNKALTINIKKAPLSLQESGIFEDEDEDDEDVKVELINCGIQTEAPSCELLQEVERLEQLRERIQERTVKVPQAQIDGTSCEMIIEGKLLFYKERIKELEDKLKTNEIVDAERNHEQAIIKQREEDLLDENYRLTEKVYKLENDIHSYENYEKIVNTRECATSTDVEIEVIDCLDCRNLKKDYNDILEKYREAKNLFRQKEMEFGKTLENVDANWNERMANLIAERDSQMINMVETIRQLGERVSQPMDLDRIQSSISTQTDDISRKQIDDVVMSSRCETFEDGENSNSIKKSVVETPEKVIRKRWKCRSEREGWAMKVSKLYQDKSNLCIAKRKSIIDKHHLILYPEISV